MGEPMVPPWAPSFASVVPRPASLGLRSGKARLRPRLVRLRPPTMSELPRRHRSGCACVRRGHPVVLGGVTIDHPRGLVGHSDGDVIAHALTDALLGAAGLGDIGSLFPSDDESYRGADSLVLLADAYSRVQEAGFELVNADCVLIGEEPRIAGVRDACATPGRCARRRRRPGCRPGDDDGWARLHRSWRRPRRAGRRAAVPHARPKPQAA